MVKKVIAFLLLISFFSIFTGCGSQEVSREAVSTRYTARYTKTETEYRYVYNLASGDFRLMPYINTSFEDEKYEVQYKITYEDGSTSTVWQKVDKNTFIHERDKIP